MNRELDSKRKKDMAMTMRKGRKMGRNNGMALPLESSRGTLPSWTRLVRRSGRNTYTR